MAAPRTPRGRRFEFTKAAIDALPPHDPASPSRETEYSDSACCGLHLAVSKTERKFFLHRFRLHGRKRSLAIGEYSTAFGPKEARLLVAQQRAALARGEDPAARKAEQRAEPTFDEFVRESYLPHARVHKRTADADEQMFRRTLSPAWGKRKLAAITFDDVVRLQAKELARTSPCSANHTLTLVKRIFCLGVKSGALAKNPAEDVVKVKERPHRSRYLTMQELPRFLRALDEDGEDRLSACALRLLLLTGCRRGELLSLTWPQVRLDEQRLHLALTKNGTARSVLLSDKAAEVLRDLWERKGESARTERSQYVFPSREGTRKGHLFDLRKPFRRACRVAGIEGLRIHDLRHSYAALALVSGASLYDVQTLLGHKDLAVTQRYAHLSSDHLRRATENVSALVEQVAAAG